MAAQGPHLALHLAAQAPHLAAHAPHFAAHGPHAAICTDVSGEAAAAVAAGNAAAPAVNAATLRVVMVFLSIKPSWFRYLDAGSKGDIPASWTFDYTGTETRNRIKE